MEWGVINTIYSYLPDKGVVFGAPLTEEGIAQIYQLIEYLSKSEYLIIYQQHCVCVCVCVFFDDCFACVIWDAVTFNLNLVLVKAAWLPSLRCSIELAWGHGLFLGGDDVIRLKWTPGVNARLNN